ncbi:hypothetical protein QJQ45_009574 [Haematococcus lacustris]|nr:hypothetical protein QJQ45_009574 [Haematococcus lacustris]
MARPASNNVRVALEYCVKQEQRPSILALRALNIETALVAEQVKSKEPALVQVRYQWWRDGISAAFKGSAPKHPVLLALQAVLPGSAMKAYPMKRLLEAREADALDTQPPLAVDGLEQYAEGTASQLLYLQLAAVGVQSREADHAASHLGKAVGIATLLRGLPYHAARRRSYVPMDLAVKYGVSQEDVYAGSSSEGMRDVALSIASVAKQHLDEARAFAPKLPRTACAVMLSSRWNENIKLELLHLTAATPAGTSLVAIQQHVAVTLATWDAVWGEYLHPKWAEQRMRLHGAQEKVLERYFMKVGVPKGRGEGAGPQADDCPTCDLLGAHVPSSAKDVMRFVCALCAMQLEEEAASVSQQEWGTRKQLVVFFGNASIGTRGGWGAKAVLQACRKVVERPNSGKPTDRVQGKVVTVDEFRTSRVSSILNSPQPCEEELDRSKPTRLEGWKPKPGQVQHRLLRSAWSKRFEAPVRGLMWCPWLAQATPGKLGKWVDRDCNAALNLQRAGESKWRPLELCRWQHRGRLPAQGKEYPALGFKMLRERAPKAQAQQPVAQ